VTARHRGFTLIEILVVMSLLSIIMLAMSSSMRTMAQTEARVDERLQRIDEMRVTDNFLKKTLGRIDVVKSKNPNNPAGLGTLFVADANSMSWVGIMPARYGAGGRYFFHLALEETSSGKALVLRFAPWEMQTTFPEWAQAESHILAAGITDFLIETEGLPQEIQSIASDWPRGWHAGWSVKDAIPQRIRLTWADQKDHWPPLVIALMPTLQSQTASSGFVTGGAVH